MEIFREECYDRYVMDMKNKDFFSNGLFLLIVVLIGIASCYYIFYGPNKGSSFGDKPQEKEPPVQNPVVKREGSFKVITTYEEFLETLDDREGILLVLGRTGCHYCEMFKPVLESTSMKYGFRVAYLDISLLNGEDYSNFFKTDLTIPGTCTNSGEETLIGDGFGTPLSLFVKEKESYDCMRGYMAEEKLISRLREKNYILEE